MSEPEGPRVRRTVRPDAILFGEEVGGGPSVLLLHAGGERRQVWRPVTEFLVGAGFRCVAFDQRGHGESGGTSLALAPYADDVAAMVDAESPGCVIVGASLGGLAAIAALADRAVRTRVAGLVLVDVVPDPDPSRVRRFLAAGGLLDSRLQIVDDVLARIPQLRQATAQLDIPVHLVRGGRESPVTDDDVDRLLSLAPQATVTRIPGAGHLVARDQPVALGETIAAVTVEWPALALLRELDAGQADHPGGYLLDHLLRVRDLVNDMRGGQRVRLAALCHAAYGTDGFSHGLLPLDQRARLRAAIGEESEELVYLYGACDRKKTYRRLGATPLPLTDRFTGHVHALAGADLIDFAVLTIANELDVARTAALTPAIHRGIRALITALAAYTPDAAARALADPHLQ